MATNTARKLNVRPESEIDKRYELIKGNKRARRVTTIRSGLFLMASMCILVLTMVYYLSLQSDITNASKSIAAAERQLNELKLDNDENYSRITSDVNLEEIRRIAIQELGMQYADESQIVIINGEEGDYVRQTGEIPK